MVEAVAGGQVLRQVPQVPLADADRRVTPDLERLGEGNLRVGDAAGRVGEEYAVQAAADRQPAGQDAARLGVQTGIA